MLRKGLLRMEGKEEQQQKEREESSNNTKITTITSTVVTSEKEKGVNNLVTLEKNNNNKDRIDNNAIPLEIDIHFQMYGKYAGKLSTEKKDAIYVIEE